MYIVMTATAQMPTSVRSRYKRVAVVELTTAYAEQGLIPKMISPRARGVERIVQTWEKLNVGKNVKSAYTFALTEANELCDRLNAGELYLKRKVA